MLRLVFATACSTPRRSCFSYFSRVATDGSRARKALPRWEIAFFFGRFHLRGSEFFARFRGTGGLIVGHEQWIISEAVLAMRFMQQHTRHFADFHGLAGNRITAVGTGASFGFRHHQCGCATETCGTLGVRNVGDLREQQRIIGFVVAMLA